MAAATLTSIKQMLQKRLDEITSQMESSERAEAQATLEQTIEKVKARLAELEADLAEVRQDQLIAERDEILVMLQGRQEPSPAVEQVIEAAREAGAEITETEGGHVKAEFELPPEERPLESGDAVPPMEPEEEEVTPEPEPSFPPDAPAEAVADETPAALEPAERIKFPMDATKLWRVRMEKGQKEYLRSNLPDLTNPQFMALSLEERVVYYKVKSSMGKGRGHNASADVTPGLEVFRDSMRYLTHTYDSFSKLELSCYLGLTPSDMISANMDSWIEKGCVIESAPRSGPVAARYKWTKDIPGYKGPTSHPIGEPPTPNVPEAKTRGKTVAKTGKKGRVKATHPDIQMIIQKCQQAGVKVERTGGDHFVVFAPKGRVIMSATPSDSRAALNIRAELRRKGMENVF